MQNLVRKADIFIRAHGPLRVAVGFIAIGLIGLLDNITGSEIRIYPFYFVPVALSAWAPDAKGVWMASVASTITWAVSNFFVGSGSLSLWIWAFNSAAQLSVFLCLGYLMLTIRRRADRETLLARVDALTGLHNLRGFYDLGHAEIERARRYRRPFTLAYLDLDNFKTVNDTIGHQAGDTVLRVVADVLRESSRTTDIIGRIGGDEFVLMLPETSADAATPLLERHRMTMQAAMGEHGWPVTVSIGAATFEDAVESLDASMRVVDNLMYDAKRAGRNTVRMEHR